MAMDVAPGLSGDLPTLYKLGTNSSPKSIKMVKDSIRTVRKVSYSLVKEFAQNCPKSGKWMRRLAVLIKDVESSWKQCLKIAPNA